MADQEDLEEERFQRWLAERRKHFEKEQARPAPRCRRRPPRRRERRHSGLGF